MVHKDQGRAGGALVDAARASHEDPTRSARERWLAPERPLTRWHVALHLRAPATALGAARIVVWVQIERRAVQVKIGRRHDKGGS